MTVMGFTRLPRQEVSSRSTGRAGNAYFSATRLPETRAGRHRHDLSPLCSQSADLLRSQTRSLVDAAMLEVVTLAERHRRKMACMEAAIVEIDRLLSDYARRHGGRFIRYGSTAKGRMRVHSDVDIIADFDDADASQAACRYAEELCFAERMIPDVRPSVWISGRFIDAVLAEGVILS